MIGQYTLKMLCEKYGISSDKLVNKNNNILTNGEYQDIDSTLDYLVNILKISSNNIEKCPSILYRNVNNIRENVDFIRKCNIHFSNIESCLHVLNSEPSELKMTYEYVKENYGLDIINRITSILSVPKDIIKNVEKLNIPFTNKNGNLSVAVGIEWGSTNLEEIQNIIQSQEFKEHPEMFTSTTLASAKLEEIQNIIQSQEFKEHPELFTSQTLARAKFEEIKKIIQSKEFEAHPELFTSTTLAHAKLEEIQKIIQSKEFEAHPELFTSQTLAYAKFEEIQNIIQSDEFKEHPELFTSETLAHAKLEEIQNIIQSKEFKEHPELFTSQTLARAKFEEIQKIIQSQEFNEYPELFTSQTLAYAKLEEIQNIIQSKEFKEHPELFTSETLARAKFEEIQKIIQSQEFKEHPKLFTSETLARAKFEEIQKIIRSDEFKAHPKLFTSQTLARAKFEEIQKLLQMDCWNDKRYSGLLTSSIVANSKSMISKLPFLFRLAEENNIDNFLNTSFLLFSPSQNYALIQYLKENNLPLVIDGKLNPIFGKQPGLLKKKYNIDIKVLIQKYKYEENDVNEMNGGIIR
ncbi:MAG: hypothetical protein MSH48_04170 [Mollicutes bacterium]|nr:hypothetical protein [Mollicutes bacterium]